MKVDSDRETDSESNPLNAKPATDPGRGTTWLRTQKTRTTDTHKYTVTYAHENVVVILAFGPMKHPPFMPEVSVWPPELAGQFSIW